MNKMDLNMTSQTAQDEDKPRGLWAGVRRILVFAAPLVVIAGAIGLLGIMMATAPKPEEKGEAPHPPAVQFGVVHSRPTTISLNVQGETRPRVEATLASQVAGRLVWASPKFADGGSFTEGEVMARIDNATANADLIADDTFRAFLTETRQQIAKVLDANIVAP